MLYNFLCLLTHDQVHLNANKTKQNMYEGGFNTCTSLLRHMVHHVFSVNLIQKFSIEQNVEVSDTTKADLFSKADLIKIKRLQFVAF